MDITVLCGGTTEREDSLISGAAIHQLLLQAGFSSKLTVLDDFKPETIARLEHQPTVIMLHGGFGEGGALQAYFEMASIPFSGSNSLSSGLALNKWISKRLFRDAGISVPEGFLIGRSGKETSQLGGAQFPLVLKPVNGGSSQEVSLVGSCSALEAILDQSTTEQWIAETFIAGVNVTVALLETQERLHCFRPLQIILDQDTALYDVQAKTKGRRRYRLFEPGEEQTERLIMSMAKVCHQTLGCFGATRVDFILDPHQTPFALEINTVPGMSESGNFRSSVRLSGFHESDLISGLVDFIRPSHVFSN